MLGLYLHTLESAHEVDVAEERASTRRQNMVIRRELICLSEAGFRKRYRLSTDLFFGLVVELTPFMPTPRRSDSLDIESKVDHCAPPHQGRAYQTPAHRGGPRHLAALCFDADRALPLAARAAASGPPLPPHREADAPRSLLGNFNQLCNLIGFICIKVSNIWVSAIFYNLLYWIAIILTLFLLLSYSFHVVEKYDRWPWLKGEFFYCCAVSLIYIVLAIVATVAGEGGYAVGFFGFCAIIAYGFDGFLKYKAWKRGLPPQ